MMSAIMKKIKPTTEGGVVNKKDKEITLKVLVYNQNIWGSDTVVASLQEKNPISRKYWIEKIEVVQYTRAVIDNVIEQSYDILIMSYEVDRCCLREVVEKVKEVDSNVQILLLSNTHNEEIEVMMNDELVDSFMLTPFQSSSLWHQIDELMD